ncbi:MAG: chromosome segregation protein SMC [Aphanocapsa feldmannii 288cV]|nr:MAG: chromosome segregation protein SMC [Aphanocapsa feldmannii 288cV]
MSKLNSITIRGYRSFREATLQLRCINVLIGANGAGKSNLVSFFKMLNELMAGHLQQYVGLTGGASSNLHFGPKFTQHLEAELEFETDSGGINTYRMQLSHAAGDTLIFTEECLSFLKLGSISTRKNQLGGGHKETLIGTTANEKNDPSMQTAKVFRHLLNNCRVFHFHDTSSTARVRNSGYIGNDKPLMPDAGNLAAVLFRLQSKSPGTYQRIVNTIQQIAPFFNDFVLEPSGSADKNIILNWRHHKSDIIFGPHQLSDGTLRAICLVSLLMLPVEELPILIVIDEPELGLHPYAITLLASLIKQAATSSQIIVSSQSPLLLDYFEPEDVLVTDRVNGATQLTHLDSKDLEEWLKEYSLGELWEKNEIGGRPRSD